MKKFISVLAVFLIAGISFGGSGRGFDVKYQRVSADEMRLDFTTDYTLSVVEKNGIMYTQIDGTGSIMTNDKGYAEVPRFASSVQLKDDRNVDMIYDAQEYNDIELEYPLLPSRGVISREQNPSEIPYEIIPESVTDTWYPGEIAMNTDPFIFRDVRGTSIVIHPYQYNAAKKILRVYKTVAVTLKENYEKPVNPLNRVTKNVVSEMSGIYKTVFINYNESKALSIGEEGELLIVYTSQNGGLAALQPYIDWKKQKGFKVNTLEVANGTDLSTTTDIQDAYDANNNILYVELIGDWANLKSAYLNSVTSTYGNQDPMLGCTVGTDQYIDVIVGRISAQSEADVTNQINKAINYEKNPQIGAAWYSKALGMSSDEGTGDDAEYDYEHAEIIGTYRLLPYTFDTVNYVSVEYGDNAADESGYLNAGVSFVNSTGHGSYDQWQSPYFYNSDVLALTNGSMLPYIVSVACLVGHVSWATGDCFAETWLKHTSGGAVVGMFSSISQPWVPPMVGQDYFADILVGGYNYDTQPGSGINITEQRTHFGSIACNATNMMLFENPTDASTKDTQEAWSIFGDVTLQVRTDQPILIDNGNTTLLISNYSTTITSGGSPVEGAVVTLFQNGTVYSGVTNSSGYVSIDHDFTVASDVIVTVSGYNLETEQSTMMVTGDIGGDFSLDHSSLDFGYVTVNGSLAMQFTITNDHNSEVIIGEITSPSNFTVANASKDTKNTMTYAVLENSSKTFNLFFEPTAQTSYSGNVVITSSDPAHDTEYISVSGAGSYPDINLASSTGATALPGGTVGDSFDIQNTGLAGLNYSLSNTYSGYYDQSVFHSNNFESGLVYTNSGTRSWATATGGTWNSSTICAKATALGASTGTDSFILTTATFDGSAYNAATLDFDQEAVLTSSNLTLEFNDGTGWVTIYSSSTSATGHQTISLPSISTTMQLRFSCVLTRKSGSSWGIDNVSVLGDVPHSWLTFNSPTSGLVAGSGSNTISLTYDSSDLPLGVYESDITVSSDDPDEPSEVIHVTFTVSAGSAPEVPANTTVVTATASEVNLGWDSVTGATSYNIYRSTEPYSGFVKIGTSGTNSYQDTDVSAGNRYFYYITSEN